MKRDIRSVAAFDFNPEEAQPFLDWPASQERRACQDEKGKRRDRKNLSEIDLRSDEIWAA